MFLGGVWSGVWGREDGMGVGVWSADVCCAERGRGGGGEGPTQPPLDHLRVLDSASPVKTPESFQKGVYRLERWP